MLINRFAAFHRPFGCPIIRRTLRILPVLCVIAVGACGDKTDPDAVVRTDSSGIEIVKSPGTYKKMVWAFDTIFTLGGAADSAFQRVRQHTVAVAGDGHIMVLDTDRNRVEVYDATGKLVKRMEAAPGGNLRMPSAVVVHNGEFAVYDVDDWSLVRFSSTGEYLGRALAPRQFREGMIRSDSGALVIGQRVRDRKTDTPIMSIVRVTSTDTTSIIAATIEDPIQTSLPVCGGVMMMLEPIFAEPPAWTAGYGITAVAEAPLYGVRLYRGNTEFRRIRRGVEPEEASNQFATLAAEPGKLIRRPDGTSCTVDATEVARASGWKDVIPAIGGIAIAPDGSLWLQRVDPGHSHPNVDIIDPKGAYVGTLPLNTPWPVGFLPNGDPVALAEDSLGITRVIGYRINKNPPPKN